MSQTEKSLQEMIIAYLEERGWYFDWDEVLDDAWLTPSDARKNKRPDAIRVLHGWTLPQWGEYWQKPYSDDPNHENYGTPKSRRYECLKDALWSQLLREEEPEKYGGFFGDKKEA